MSAEAGGQALETTPREQAVGIDRVALAGEKGVELERLGRGLRRPWSLAFLPDGELLIVEKHGGLRVFRKGVLEPEVLAGGPPDVLAKVDSGLLDVALDPDFGSTRWVYVAYAEGDETANRTAIWKARYVDHALVDGHTLFRSRPDKAGVSHPGGRLLFLPDKTLLLTVGDGYDYQAAAQDLSSHLGKTLRLKRDGTVPADNPFVELTGALPEIWTRGHRNAQGLALDPRAGDVWLHEHGPRGGDEINLLRAGANYGWPVVTHGIDYDGTIISDRTVAPGIERSAFYWAPSIAPSGLAVVNGPAFADWQGQLLVGGLMSRSVIRLRRGNQTGLFVEEARMLRGLNERIRDVRIGPDGLVYLLTDDDDGQLLRMRPAP